ncbi:replicative DNA helicase [bacterium]|nr:replicative DNA helicase [bacterium]
MNENEEKAKTPPFSQAAEEALLGAVLLESDVMADIVDIVGSSDFYRPQNKKIFEHLTKMWENREPIDIITLQESLKEKKTLIKVGGAVYLDQLFDNVPSSQNAKRYAGIVHKMALRREIANLGQNLIDLAVDSPETSEKIMDVVGQKFFSLTQLESVKDNVKMKEMIVELQENIERLMKDKGYSGLETGFRRLDNMLGGFQKSDFIILAARPSVGKTAMALNILEEVTRNGGHVLFFSLEMSAQQLAMRLLTSISGINSQRIRRGNITRDVMDENIMPALAIMDGMNITFNENATISPLGIRSEARKCMLKSENKIDLVIIDYIQLISSYSARRQDNRVQEVSDISRALKSLGRELNVPILALSQLSRASEKENREPVLSDLRESGALEQDSDVVMFLHRVTPRAKKKKPGEAQDVQEEEPKILDMKLIVAKHRNGPTGVIKMKFEKRRTKFFVETQEQEDVFVDDVPGMDSDIDDSSTDQIDEYEF